MVKDKYGHLYFSPKYRFRDLDFADKDNMIRVLSDRFLGFYLCPAKLLVEQAHLFSAGLICVAAIDFLARLSTTITGNERISVWLKSNADIFAGGDQAAYDVFASRFCDEYRNGLVHECRIKNGGQFTGDINSTYKIEADILIVNPVFLVKDIESAFNNFVDNIKADDDLFNSVKNMLTRDFARDVENIRISRESGMDMGLDLETRN